VLKEVNSVGLILPLTTNAALMLALPVLGGGIRAKEH
jgi:hypothetical protein